LAAGVLVAACLIGTATGVYGQTVIIDCYEVTGLQSLEKPPTADIVVMLDETTVLDEHLKTSLNRKLAVLVKPGVHITVVRFSAFIAERYARVEMKAKLAVPLTDDQRNQTRKPVAQAYDQCLEIQQIRVQKALSAVVGTYAQSATTTIVRSDILGSLRDVGQSLLQRSAAKRKVVFLVSDMLENSSVTTFYHGNGVRQLKPEDELRKVEQANLFTDLSGAKVYVMGAGLIPVSSKDAGTKSYRSPPIIGALEHFWRSYFAKSNARLTAFGTPELMEEITLD
jgi:hypothetical protein